LPEDAQPEPTLVVYGPDGHEHAKLTLAKDKITVGRLAGLNDLALEPDPQKLVTRQEHLALERDGSRWVVVDSGSRNGTFVRRAGALERVGGRLSLIDGDVICVVALLSEPDKPKYWELSLDDPGRTRGASFIPRPACLAYDASEARLFLVQGNERHEIVLRPQAHRLVGYMARRNAGAGGTAVLCSHDELMTAVWADEPMHTREELNKLFWELRRKLQPLGAQELIESARGLGYRIRTCG
jgi:hypothetical protein